MKPKDKMDVTRRKGVDKQCRGLFQTFEASRGERKDIACMCTYVPPLAWHTETDGCNMVLHKLGLGIHEKLFKNLR